MKYYIEDPEAALDNLETTSELLAADTTTGGGFWGTVVSALSGVVKSTFDAIDAKAQRKQEEEKVKLYEKQRDAGMFSGLAGSNMTRTILMIGGGVALTAVAVTLLKSKKGRR